MKLQLFCDGGSRGNPGPAAYGYVVYDVSNNNAGLPAEALAKAGIILEKCGNYLGITTNNQAEYAALIAGLTWVVKHYPTAQLIIRMDSLLIVNQVKGEYKVKNLELLPKFKEVKTLLTQISNWSIHYVPRSQNSEADALVNLALDNHH